MNRDIDEFSIVIRSNGRVRADYCDFSGVYVERNHTDVINFYMEEDRRANVKMDLVYKGIEDDVTDNCRKLITYILESKDASGEW
jgi:lysine/ornithine N-monooxygenase